MLVENLERSMFTFNLQKINEICFNKLNKNIGSSNDNLYDSKINNDAVEICINKYLESFKVIKSKLDKVKTLNEINK